LHLICLQTFPQHDISFVWFLFSSEVGVFCSFLISSFLTLFVVFLFLPSAIVVSLFWFQTPSCQRIYWGIIGWAYKSMLIILPAPSFIGINVYFLPSYSPLKAIKCPTLWCDIISMWCWASSFEIYVITVIHCHRMCTLTLLCIYKVGHEKSCWFCHLMGYGFGHDLGSICESSHLGWWIKARHGAAACKHGRTCNFLFILPWLLELQSLHLCLLV
jgi:hypothetical protein